MFCFVLFFGPVWHGMRQTTCLKKEIPDHELSWLKRWTCVRQSARSILSVFCWYYFLGPYLHWPFLLDYYYYFFAGLCFSRANADLRYITIWNALDFATSITVWLWTLRETRIDTQTRHFNVRSFIWRKHAESKCWRNLSMMCITSGFLS